MVAKMTTVEVVEEEEAGLALDAFHRKLFV